MLLNVRAFVAQTRTACQASGRTKQAHMASRRPEAENKGEIIGFCETGDKEKGHRDEAFDGPGVRRLTWYLR